MFSLQFYCYLSLSTNLQFYSTILILGSHLRSPHWYILVHFNSTLPLARYAQSHYALLAHWGYALHSTNRATCSAFSLGISYVQDVIHQKCNKHHTTLEAHENPLLKTLLVREGNRRLKRNWPIDLIWGTGDSPLDDSPSRHCNKHNISS
jgi:hypothetical protein